MENNIFSIFDNGRVTTNGETTELATLPWVAHKDFNGVYLKTVVKGDNTDGRLICHLVKIDPGKKIGMHTHPDSIELHEVISGHGTCITKQGNIAYAPGSVAVLAMDSPHEVQAGENGLYLFAKFIIIQG